MADSTGRALALLTLLTLSACNADRPAPPPEATLPAGTTLKLVMARVPDVKIVSAEITSRDQAEARARIPGTLASLSVAAGDTVKRGQPIGMVTDSRLGFETSAASARLAAAEADAARARSDLARIEDLYRNQVYAKARLDAAIAAARSADAQVAAARAGAGASAAVAGQGAILAPASGRVLRADVPAGSVVSPGQSVATITAGPAVLRLMLPETLAGSLRLGAPVTLAEPVAGVGRISRIYPAIIGGQVMADVTLPGAADPFIGRRVGASIEIGQRQAIVVPRAYVSTRYGIDHVNVVVGQTISAVPVQTAPLAGADRIEILSGVGAGDTIFRAAPGTAR
jgi:RND family efflux transporter MFP subunit